MEQTKAARATTRDGLALLWGEPGGRPREQERGRPQGSPWGLTRVGFLGSLFPFALARATGRLAFAPFHPLSFPLFLPLLLLGRRQHAGGRKVLWPGLRPQSRLRPRLSQPNGGDQAQASAGDATEFASAWLLRP